MTRFRIDYHPYVDGDLMDIATLIADFAGLEAANRKLEEFEEVVRNLEDFPTSALCDTTFVQIRAPSPPQARA